MPPAPQPAEASEVISDFSSGLVETLWFEKKRDHLEPRIGSVFNPISIHKWGYSWIFHDIPYLTCFFFEPPIHQVGCGLKKMALFNPQKTSGLGWKIPPSCSSMITGHLWFNYDLTIVEIPQTSWRWCWVVEFTDFVGGVLQTHRGSTIKKWWFKHRTNTSQRRGVIPPKCGINHYSKNRSPKNNTTNI